MPMSLSSCVQSSFRCNSLAEISSIPVSAAEQNSNWQVLLRRFRSLRATLVSHDKISWFAVRAYLWSTDVSLCSTDHAECLKALQALVCQLFPVLDTQDKACQSLCSLTSSSKPGDTEVCSQIFAQAKPTVQLLHQQMNMSYVFEPAHVLSSFFDAVIHALQTCKDWGKDSWLSTDQKSESADTKSRPVRQDASDHWRELEDKPKTESANIASGSSLQCLWAHCAGLLVLYFTCVPQTKQAWLWCPHGLIYDFTSLKNYCFQDALPSLNLWTPCAKTVPSSLQFAE